MHWPEIDPEYLAYLLKLGKTALIAVVGLIAIYVIRSVSKRQLQKIYPDALRVDVLIRMLSYALFFLLATIVLQQFGINMTAIIGAAGVVGVAIGFAAQTSVANIISGLFLTMEHPFELNDSVAINNVEGKIKKLDLFAVTICTFDNKVVRISNEQVLKATITNISKNKERRLDTSVDIEATANSKETIAIIERLAKEAPYLVNTKAPFIAISQVTGTYTRISIGVWSTQKEWGNTRQLFLTDLKEALKQNGIALAERSLLTQ